MTKEKNMFKILKSSKISKARVGKILTSKGEIATPFFMPDATRAAVKYLDSGDLERLNMPAMVVNTFHLYLQPGSKLIKKTGGVNKFMDFNRPLLSDSGGFQVFSLVHKNKQMGKIREDGVEFKSPLDGYKHLLTPAKSIQIQFELGTDMIVVFDDCPPNDFDEKAMDVSVERTIRWAKICKEEFDKNVKNKNKRNKGNKKSDQPLLFGVIQGGVNKELRKKCAEALIEIGFDGYGFGARPVDVEGNFLGDVLEFTADLIPADKLRFGLGIGTPEDIVRCVGMGWDMFDCVIPTREGRHGRLFSWKRNPKSQITNSKQHSILNIQNTKNFYNTINITNAKYAKDFSPLNADSKIKELRNCSLAYLHHLFKAKEPLGARLATLNNLEFYVEMMEKIREEIKTGKF
jgi:queuine tRNA-ribosyltransferase